MTAPGPEPTAVLNPAHADYGVPPRLSREKAVLVVLASLAVAGAVVGALWAAVAPGIHGVVALSRTGERLHASIGADADHFFIAAFMFVGFSVVVAVVAAVALWQWRAHRGPVMVAALAAGCALGTAVAAGVGTALAHWRYGGLDIAGAPVTPEHRVDYVLEAASVFFGPSQWQIATTILFPAAAAALVYALIAVSTVRDDLGAWPPQDPPPPIRADVAGSPAP